MQNHVTYRRARLPLAIASALGVILMVVSTETVGVGSFEDFAPQNAKRDALSGVAQISFVTQQGRASTD